MLSFIKLLSFIANTSIIFCIECIKYAFNRDQNLFIRNIAKKLASGNILYVKIFQAISLTEYSKNNEFANKLNAELIKFTDNAPYNESDVNHDLLMKVIEENDLVGNIQEPIKSGMISLVYKMRKANSDANTNTNTNTNANSEIILKVKRANIEKNLLRSINDVMLFMKFLSLLPLPIMKTFDIGKAIEKNFAIIYQQLNFREEVENMKAMKDLCKHMNYVVVPKVYDNVTEIHPDVIMMEYINGNTIQNVSSCDYDIYSKLVVKFGFACVLNHGLAHGDLHSGNILFIKDTSGDVPLYKLGILDYGIMIKINDAFKKNLINVCANLFDSNPRDSAARFFLTSIESSDPIKFLTNEHYDKIIDMIASFVDTFLLQSKNIEQAHLYSLLKDLNSYFTDNDLTKYGLSLNSDFIKLQISFAMCQGVTFHLSGERYVDIANAALNEMFHTDLL